MATKTILTGNADAENTLEKPNHVVPENTIFNVSKNFIYQAPAMSLTVIRIKAK